jgi:hypothetical protein
MRNSTRANILIISFMLLVGMLLFAYLPVTYEDWIIYFNRAARNWRAPFIRHVFNPPWLFLALHPLSWLPARWGAAALMVLSTTIVLVYVRSPWKSLFILTSVPMQAIYILGQIDALPLLGLVVAPTWSLPLLAIKPQGIFLTALRRLTVRSILAMLIVLALSVLVWGPWWSHFQTLGGMPDEPHNASLFPYSLVAGLPLVWLGLKRKSDALLCWASLCLTPYFMIASLLPAVAASIKESEDPRVWFAVWLGSWAFLVIMKVV